MYLDVSGSVSDVLPLLIGTLIPAFHYVHDNIHLFSTQIADMPLHKVRRGKIQTTCGTEISCVTRHILEEDVRRALLVTDGWVGEVPAEHARQLRRRKVRINSVILSHGDASFAAAVRGTVYRLPLLTKH